eukprot:CAMPEP_0177647334 /NCGR_PEP_ID=MMETSP0447-20121125/10243_1 /TAXON_ID=0 /ORGANISM="Stygamoeba regulata, Strain BSH-02190019" /LENGTH=1221 /DNA_ID=CAMNT_0019149909 /DNA_START=85 /DNA_END=3750 /DNA_ORIENTATION=-
MAATASLYKPPPSRITERVSPLTQSMEQWKATRGQEVWIPDKEEAFTQSVIYKVDDEQVETEKQAVPRSKVWPINPKTQDGVPDNTEMMYLYDPNLLHNLRVRYDRDEIYTYTAYILIAINPYKQLPIYSTENIHKYHKTSMRANPPHVFGIAERAYRHMKSEKKSQSIVVSGDSGSGKTETCKYVLRYLTTIAGRDEGQGKLEKQILEANPLLEAFGNAKTLRNNNSSRFGKFVEVHFDSKFEVAGARITTYLLEKSRLVQQPSGERNYHVFYQMCRGASAAEKSRWFLEDLETYHYLRQSGCTSIDGVDDAKDYHHLREAMSTVGITSEQQESIFKTLAGLLHLGNVVFAPADEGESSKVSDHTKQHIEHACTLLKVNQQAMEEALTTRTLSTGGRRGTMYRIPLKPFEASFARDALAKHVYGKLFDWLVAAVNNGIPMAAEAKHFIGILDISGFEYFNQNGFEQFLINYCNEKIQQYFTVQILQQEQEIYLKEGLRWRQVEVPNSFDTLELIEAKRTGILPLLEESCILPRATDQTFTLRVHKQHFNHSSLMKPSSSLKDVPGIGNLKLTQEEAFIVRHFAADVCYQTTGFLEKNNDTLHSDLLLLMSNKAGDFVGELFNGGGIAGSDQPRSRFGTLSGTFLSGISDLMARLSTTSSNFIRCINPNELMKPALINAPACMTQLRCSGMLEALVIMQAGYPTRCLFTDLHARYYDLMPKEISRLKPRTFCEALLVALDLEGGKDFQMGLSRVFFRAGKLAFMEDLMNGSMDDMFEVVGKVKAWLARKRWLQAIHAVRSINICGKLIEDIRAAARSKEEERLRKSAAYQAELRRREEELRRQQEEERKRREEEERIRQEQEAEARRVKAEKKAQRQAELARLREEAQEKATLESQLAAERDTYAELEESMREEIASLESKLDEQIQQRLATLDALDEAKTSLKMMNIRADGLDEEVARLRARVQELEEELARAHKQIQALKDALALEKAAHTEDVDKLKDELEHLKKEHALQLAAAEESKQLALAKARVELDATIAKLRSEFETEKKLLLKEHETEMHELKEEKEQNVQLLEKISTKPLKTGYLTKRGGSYGKWQRRFFVLKSNFLSYFKDPKDAKPAGLIDLENARVYRTNSKKKADIHAFEVVTPNRTYYIRAEAAVETEEWIQALNLAKARHLSAGTVDLNTTSVTAARKLAQRVVPISPRFKVKKEEEEKKETKEA